MKKIYLLLLSIIILSGNLFSQVFNLSPTQHGYIFTDEMSSTIYLFQDDKLEELVSAPGCGNYFQVSSDGNKVGFKLIEDGIQIPCVIDLNSKTIIRFNDPVIKCGQVNFDEKNNPAFTIDKDLHYIKDGKAYIYHLGYYANIAPISPNGEFVVFNDENDDLWLMNLENSEKEKITNDGLGYYLPKWSPDSKKILFNSLKGDIFIYDIKTKELQFIDEGTSANWSKNSEQIFYIKQEIIEFFEIISSDVFCCDLNTNKKSQITDTPDILEMNVYEKDKGQIIFSNMGANEINYLNYDLNKKNNSSIEGKILLPNIKSKFFPETETYKISEMSALDAPYLHQVYDTPPWHDGHWSCAPTTAAMVLAYYNILPKWAFSCSSPYQHTSYWGGYVAAKYMYREVNYANYTANDAGGHTSWGGYGFMWGNGSPNSQMKNYYVNHGISSATQSWSTSWATTIGELNAGYPFTMCVWLTSSGHLVLALGQAAEDHTLIFNDPYGNKNTPDYPSYDGKNAKYDWPGYNNSYKNLDYSGEGRAIPWTITQRYTPPAPRDTLVEDHYFENGFYLHNASPSKMEYWRDKKNGGYQNKHFWYTYTCHEGDTCYATWTPNLPTEKQYEVYAYISNNAACTDARYKIFHKSGLSEVNINQSVNKNKWVSLGKYTFRRGPHGYIKLGDGSSIKNQIIVFDAMVWATPGSLTGIENEISIVDKYELFQNFPNPFNPATNITFSIPEVSNVKLTIYDMLGQEVKVLVNEELNAGNYSFEFNANGLSSGVYIYEIKANNFVSRMKMTLLK